MKLAALVGLWDVTFVVAWAPLLVCGAAVALVGLWGSVRLLMAPTDRPTIRIATLNRPVDLFVPGEMTRISEGSIRTDERPIVQEKPTRLQDWFLEGSRREARAGARLVAWPEQNLLIFAEDEPAFFDRARRVAREERIYLAIGMGTVHLGAPRPFENKLVLVDPTGTIVASYLKTHAVAGWEARIMRPGDGNLPIVATAHGRMSGAICFDADFPELIRQSGQGQADLLIVPANDWREVKVLHAEMAAFRAIENGVSLIRPAASGLSSAFDPWGRLLGFADYFAQGDRTLTAQVPVTGVRTLYARTGDLFAWLCVVGTVISIGLAMIGRSTFTFQRTWNLQRASASGSGRPTR